MRKVLRSADEVIHFWANQVQSEGRVSNIFFEGPDLYSYGKHFAIGRILPTGVAVLTTRKYSATTNKQVWNARSAVNHRTRVYCSNPVGHIWAERTQIESDIRVQLVDAERPRIRQTTKDKHYATARHLAEQFNAYQAALIAAGVDVGVHVTPIDVDALPAIRARIDGEQAEYAARQAKEMAEQQARAIEQQGEAIARFRANEPAQRRDYLRNIPCMLRLSADGQTVETSHGADIPTRHAMRLWPLIQSTREHGESKEFINGSSMSFERQASEGKAERVSLGVYDLTKIRGDGSIVVGCHDIAYSEMVGIAKALGLPANDPIDA
jgi:hypothetical protein